jgi:hypothetical protein
MCPGVKRKMLLHVVHSIDFWDMAHNDASASDGGGTVVIDDHDHDDDGRGCRKLRYLCVYIRRPARGWGVLLWQADVYGAVLGQGVNSIFRGKEKHNERMPFKLYHHPRPRLHVA